MPRVQYQVERRNLATALASQRMPLRLEFLGILVASVLRDGKGFDCPRGRRVFEFVRADLQVKTLITGVGADPSID